jgi:UTP:GlnB (protein PII) uridylyltransferase
MAKKVESKQDQAPVASKKDAAKKAPVSFKANFLTKTLADSLTNDIVSRGKALELDVQRLIVTAIGYANIHGDITIAQRMYSALATVKGFRLQAVINLVEAFSVMKFDDKGIGDKAATKNFQHLKHWNLTNENASKDPAEIVEVLARPENFWTEFTKPPVVKSSYDVLEQVTSILATAKKKIDGGKPVANKELVEILNVAMAQFKATQAGKAQDFKIAQEQEKSRSPKQKQEAAKVAYEQSINPPAAPIGSCEVAKA